MNPKKRFTPEVEAEIVAKYVSGRRSGELAQEYECGRKLITNMAKRYGHGEYSSRVKGGIRGINTDSLNPKIEELHAQNLSQAEIANEVGISQPVVSRVLRQLGLKPNNPIRVNRGSESNFWKGGVVENGSGYRMILSNEFPSMQIKTGYILEHRLVMARYLGRPLEKHETVHHIDGNRVNNNITNLQLRIGNHGAGGTYHCADCGSLRINPIKL